MNPTGVLFGGTGAGSGSLRVMGVNSIFEAKLALRRFAYRVKKCLPGLDPAPTFDVKNFKIQNIVALVLPGFHVRLETLATDLQRNGKPHVSGAEYEPEQFPAMRCTVKDKGSVSVFANGKVVITGAKSLQVANDAFDIIWPKIIEHKLVVTGEAPPVDTDTDAAALAAGDEDF